MQPTPQVSKHTHMYTRTHLLLTATAVRSFRGRLYAMAFLHLEEVQPDRQSYCRQEVLSNLITYVGSGSVCDVHRLAHWPWPWP